MSRSPVPWLITTIISAAAGVIAPLSATALEYQASAGYEGEYSSNASRTTVDEEADVVHRPRVDVGAIHIGPRLELGLLYRVQQRIYEDDTFQDETILEGTGDIAWHIVPERLVAFASNDRMETEVRRSEEATPDNLQETDESTAGVDLTLDSVSSHTLTLGYMYSEINLGETSNDSSRHTATATYTIPVSAVSAFSLVGTGSNVEFEDPLAPDYDSASGSIQYHRATERSVAAVSLGYQSIDRDLDRTTVDGYIGSVELIRELSAASSVGLSYSESLRDNSLDTGRRSLADDINGDGGFVGDTDTGEIYREKRAGLFLNTQLGVNAFVFDVYAARQNYVDLDRDAESVGVTANFIRPVRPNVDAHLLLGYARHEFDDREGEDDESRAEAGISWQRTPRLTLGLDFDYFERTREAFDQSIDDWTVSVSIDYVILGQPRR